MSSRRALLALALLAGCRVASPDAAPPSGGTSGAPPRVTLRILYTSDEHGFIQPVHEDGAPFRDGAAVFATLLREREGHCVPGPAEPCEDSSTLALSGGDHWTGPAISSHWKGIPAAEVLGRLGYVASAFGNHELDFGRATFEENHAKERVPFVAANVTPTRAEGGVADPFVLVRRRGLTVGVVGLATHDTVQAGLRDNYRGLRFGDEEEALSRVVPAAWASGADAVVVVAHVCARELHPIVARHPEWRLAFVGAGHCHRLEQKDAGATPVVEPGSFLRGYVRASLTFDPSRPQRERLVGVTAETVSLERAKDAPPLAAPDPEIARLVAGWQTKTSEALGEIVGYSNARLERDTPPLTNLITDAWRKATGADVAILNRYATRQAIPIGPIRRETIVSVLPFENRLVTVRVTGAELEEDVRCCGGHVSGVVEQGGALVLADGRPIDKMARYVVVTTDYGYFGGSGFPFERQDPHGVFGEDWREPVYRLLAALATSPDRGLETLVDGAARLSTRRGTDAH